MEESREWTVGNHHIRFEPPDVLWATVRGWITAEDAPKWVEIILEVTATGSVNCVVQMEEMEGFPQPRLSQAARQYLAKHSSSDWFKSMIFVGGGLLQRITAKGLALAMLLSGNQRFAIEFVDSPEKARLWHKKQSDAADR